MMPRLLVPELAAKLSARLAAKLAATIAAACLLAGAPSASAEPIYDLSFLPSGFRGVQLNDAGQVVGNAGGAAALYSGGVLTTVAPSPSFAEGINNRGDIAGTLNEGFVNEAFTSIGGTFTNIDPFVRGNGADSSARAINDHGVVGGNVYNGGENTRGFLFHDGIVERIGTFGGDYSPLAAINNHGAATGYAAFEGPAGGYFHAYLYQDGTLQDLGTLTGNGINTFSMGNDINNLGQVAGWSGSGAFLYSNGSMIDLGALGDYGSSATALNDNGLVVGTSYSRLTPGGTGEHAFLYAGGAMVDLNTLVAPLDGWELTIAQDINAAGQILGTACRNGTCASVLLTPVPEPAASLLLLAGLGTLAPLAARRRQRPTRIACPPNRMNALQA